MNETGTTVQPPAGRASHSLLIAATLGLALLQALPKAGMPVVLLFPPGTSPDQALLAVLAAPGWDPIAVRPFGPFALAFAAPGVAEATAGGLRRTAGAWAALHFAGVAPCAARL
ncbi:MAG: hypothetical protein K2X11_01270 [Acetobacteraceae bacterium]|nr:hypothetical protein [Acetobacteraceae bacterium]